MRGSPVPLTDWLGAGPAAAAAGSSYTIFADGFEGGTSPWQSSNSPTWGRTSYRTATGAWSAFCAGDGVGAPGPYPGSMDAWLVAGPYDLSTVTSGTLSFKVWLSSQLDHDWVSGMVSVDGVAFYGWSGSGSSSGWASRSIDLTSVPGAGNVCGHSQVWVAFVFQSDATVGGEGAYVDDVVLQGDRAPVITSFSPDSGPSFTRVAVHGSGFTGVTDVRFNGVPAQFDNASDTYLNAYVPSGASSGPISVVTPSGTGTSSQSFIFIPPPVIVGSTPKWGPVGSQVTVTGSGFTGATEVAFGGPYPGTAAVFDVVGDNQISATVPAGATTGCIAVTTPGGRAMAVRDFLVSATTPPPQLSNFAPVEAPVGSKVKLTGFCLTGATSVKFSGRAASFRVAGDELILAVVPARTMSGRITVTTPHGTGSIGTFNVMKPRPRIGTPVCPRRCATERSSPCGARSSRASPLARRPSG